MILLRRYMHKRGIAHRDLKSPNLLVDGGWRVKVRSLARIDLSLHILAATAAPAML